jgi:carbamoyl-phosphate synthase large subunit
MTRVDELGKAMARELRVCGLMNLQLAVKDEQIYVLEVNPRASRTVPFVGKATHTPWPAIAAKAMMGKKLPELLPAHKLGAFKPQPYYAIKESVFPFSKFPGVDVVLGPEMRSTGEVMGIDDTFAMAFAKSQLGAGVRLPQAGTLFVSVKDTDKPVVLPAVRKLSALGFTIVATGGTARYLADEGVSVEQVNKVAEGRPHIVDAMKNGDVHLVFNTSEGRQAMSDSFSLRQTALMGSIPYYTTVAGMRAAVEAIAALRAGALEVAPLQSYFKTGF